ncbi:FAD:protein FMN transferase [Vibrio mediterranei]|uniref:FAD:protein FMN transferase n=1 Tax=Vibrio mediterranei TaxID=689 RepID=A0AAN1FK13_9VIBR|nr:FAD:protein FMN transferase [Vibrio mediterranei]ASI92028.1 thiamine biosynthesis protein ApbE [Vibrio mediterranei]
MPSYKTRFQMMGTFIDLVIHHQNGEQLLKDCYFQLQEFAQRFTVNQSHSELMNVNHNAGIRPVRVKADLYELLKSATAVSLDNANPFNIAIGPLIKTWRIGFKDATLPSNSELASKLELVNPSHIVFDDIYQTVFLTKVGMQIDLGAIAKGYFADRIKQYLVSQEVESGYISLGGNVLTIGHAPDSKEKAWTVGIQDPFSPRGQVCRIVPLNDKSVVTSGINERFFEHNGVRYHHLLDAQSGKPIVTDIASVTIISKLSVDGEIWSTAGFLTSVDDALAYLNQQQHVEAIVISNQGHVHITHGLVDNGHTILEK